MAQSNAPGSQSPRNGRPSGMLDDKEDRVSDFVEGRSGGDEDEGRSFSPTPARAESRGFFDVYKPSQGFHTRIGTAIGFGILVCWGAYFLYEKLLVLGSGSTMKTVQVVAVTGWLLGFGLVGYWLLALNRRFSDFLIATEGEMKKVNWTSRKDIIGSTKVVIFVVIAMSIMLFIVDILFMSLFGAIGVLKGTTLADIFVGLFK